MSLLLLLRGIVSGIRALIVGRTTVRSLQPVRTARSLMPRRTVRVLGDD